MNIDITVALIGMIGVFVGTLIQYYFGVRSESSKKNIEIRVQAYTDLLNSVAEIAGSARYSEDRTIEQLQKLNQAKARVILIGSDELVVAVNNFWSEYGQLDSEEAVTSFAFIVLAMRKDLMGKNSLQLKVISEALFNTKKNSVE